MAQKSWPWSTVAGLGDGAAQLSEAISREFLAVYFGVQNPALEGVSKGVLGELAVTGTASPLAVAAGSGICYGLYINDTATTTPVISTPAVGTTGGRVVLQTEWAGTGGAGLEARTRIAVKKSADGVAAIPALTQAFGTTWEISLATFTITTGGVITVTDARTFRKSTAVVGAGGVDPGAITSANLRNSVGVSVIGRSANTTGVPADIAAGADDLLLARTGGVLGFVQATIGMIPNALITLAKMADLAGVSLLGRAANSSGVMAPITAGADDRVLARTASALSFVQLTIGMFVDASITLAKLANLAGLSVLGRSTNTTGVMGAITGTDGQALRVSGTALGFGTLVAAAYAALSVGTPALANDSVDDTKAGPRVPQFYRRQGGSATNWSTVGVTTQTPTAVRMQAGSQLFDGVGSRTITFPVAFSDVPLVFALSSGSLPVRLFSTTATQAIFTGSATEVLYWLAIGPE